MNTRIESYLWYEKGYRYPVFETIRNSNGNENENDSAFFSTAFFYPPQEHYYLGDDEDNLAVLDSLALGGDSLFIDPWEGLTYNFYPNPVVTNLEIEIYMPKTAEEVRMQLTDRLGRPVWSENYGRWTEGIHTIQVFMMPFMVGEYVLNMWFDEHLIGEKILKR